MLQSRNQGLLQSSSKYGFSFAFVEKNEIKKEINSIQVNKTVQYTDIPTKTIKEKLDLVSDFLKFDQILTVVLFSQPLEQLYLPNISEIYEKCMFNQMCEYFDSFFSKFQRGLRKGYSAQHCLLSMLDKTEISCW